MKSVLRSTFTTQGELGQRCPSEVQIRAPRGLAVMVTSLSVPRVMVLQAPRHRPTAAIVNIKVFMAAPLVRWLRNGRADGNGNFDDFVDAVGGHALLPGFDTRMV